MKLRNLFLLGLLGVAGALRAADEREVTAALAQPADATRFPEAGSVVLLDERIVTLHADGTTTTEGHRLIKILQDRAVRQLSDQKIAFRGGSQVCEIVKALTHLPDGKTQKPEDNGIMEVSDPEAAAAPFYSTARLKVISFPGVSPGATLELQYVVKSDPKAEPSKVRDDFTGQVQFGGEEPVLEKRLELRVPEAMPLKFQMFNSEVQPQVSHQGSEKRYAWIVRNQPQIVREFSTVPDGELVPRLVWTNVADRKVLGAKLAEGFEAAAKPEATVKAQAEALVKGLTTPEAKVERLALFVTKEIQNVSLPLGRVGYQPTEAKTILANRYADTRDKAVLFMALLEAVGLKAQPVFVHEDRLHMSDLACPQEYQEILARVKLASGVRYYALTQNMARLGQLLSWELDRPALALRKEGGEVLTTPALDAPSQSVHAQWAVRVEPNGDLAGQVRMTFDGIFDLQIRSAFFGRNDQDRQVMMQAVVDAIKKGARLERYEVSDFLDLTKPATLVLELRIPDFACRQGDMLILNLPVNRIPLAGSLFSPLLPAVKYPALVSATFQMESTMALRLPEGYKVAYFPTKLGVSEPSFRYEQAGVEGPEGLLLSQTRTWMESVLTPEAYSSVWKAFGQSNVPANALVLLEKK